VRDGGLVAHLCRDAHPVAHPGPAGQPPADHPLALPADAARIRPEGVAVGRVDPAAATLHEPVEEPEGGRLVGPRAVEHRAEHRRHRHDSILPCTWLGLTREGHKALRAEVSALEQLVARLRRNGS
jgi:hypothetical protein